MVEQKHQLPILDRRSKPKRKDRSWIRPSESPYPIDILVAKDFNTEYLLVGSIGPSKRRNEEEYKNRLNELLKKANSYENIELLKIGTVIHNHGQKELPQATSKWISTAP